MNHANTMITMGQDGHHGRLTEHSIQLSGSRRQEVDGREHAVWDSMLEQVLFESDVAPKDQGAVTMLIDLLKTLDKIQLTVLWNWSMYFNFPLFLLSMLYGHS